jgi:hypothetical protein
LFQGVQTVAVFHQALPLNSVKSFKVKQKLDQQEPNASRTI